MVAVFFLLFDCLVFIVESGLVSASLTLDRIGIGLHISGLSVSLAEVNLFAF
jgi:hypothetical protein